MLVPSPRRPGDPADPRLAVVDVDVVGDLAARRRAALLATRQAVLDSPADGTTAGTGIALRSYGPGCLALALGGTFAARDVARLRSLDLVLRRLATVELVLELSALQTCDRVLGRVLARVRVRALVAGATVELHGPPAELGAAVGAIDGREVWT